MIISGWFANIVSVYVANYMNVQFDNLPPVRQTGVASRGARRRVLPWLLLAVVAAGSALGIAVWYGAGQSPPPRSTRSILPVHVPELPNNRIKPLTPEQALTANAAVPRSGEPVEPAPVFKLPATSAGELARASALDCLSAAVYYEAASEPLQGQRAVAQVVLNRVRHPAFPKSVCGVVYQGADRRTGCQFTFSCDGSLARHPSERGWQLARAVAAAALDGSVERSVGMATHYHTVWVVPYWADSLTKIGVVGAHIFYRWPGFWGRPAAFNGRYVGEDQAGSALNDAVGGLAPASGFRDPAGAPVPLSAILADHSKGQLALPDGLAQNAPLAADRDRGALVTDEARGVLIPGHQTLSVKP